jgi:hypothetical protein
VNADAASASGSSASTATSLCIGHFSRWHLPLTALRPDGDLLALRVVQQALDTMLLDTSVLDTMLRFGGYGALVLVVLRNTGLEGGV